MPKTHTQTPSTTGSSIVGLKYRDGVLLAADNLASYGSLARFINVPRLARVNSQVALGCTGDYADFQFLLKTIEEKQITEESYNDGHQLSPLGLYTWLTRVQYNRRCKMDPLWCNWVVAGVDKAGVAFLGQVDKLGCSFQAPVVCTGYGAHIATPLIREVTEQRDVSTLSLEEARALVAKCMSVLFCRDARTSSSYHLAVVDAQGARIEGPIAVVTDWSTGFKTGEILLDTLAAQV